MARKQKPYVSSVLLALHHRWVMQTRGKQGETPSQNVCEVSGKLPRRARLRGRRQAWVLRNAGGMPELNDSCKCIPSSSERDFHRARGRSCSWSMVFPAMQLTAVFPLRTSVGLDPSSPLVRLPVHLDSGVQCTVYLVTSREGLLLAVVWGKSPLASTLLVSKPKYAVFKTALCHLWSSELCKVPGDAFGVVSPSPRSPSTDVTLLMGIAPKPDSTMLIQRLFFFFSI